MTRPVCVWTNDRCEDAVSIVVLGECLKYAMEDLNRPVFIRYAASYFYLVCFLPALVLVGRQGQRPVDTGGVDPESGRAGPRTGLLLDKGSGAGGKNQQGQVQTMDNFSTGKAASSPDSGSSNSSSGGAGSNAYPGLLSMMRSMLGWTILAALISMLGGVLWNMYGAETRKRLGEGIREREGERRGEEERMHSDRWRRERQRERRENGERERRKRPYYIPMHFHFC